MSNNIDVNFIDSCNEPAFQGSFIGGCIIQCDIITTKNAKNATFVLSFVISSFFCIY